MAGKKGIKIHNWTNEELEFIKVNYRKYTAGELTPLFNEKFGHNFTKDRIKSVITRYKIHSGRTGWFQKGNDPYNKGLTWDDYMPKEAQEKCRKTTFNKEGRNNCNHNHLPIGEETVGKDDYLMVKVDEPKGTKAHRFLVYKHRLIYEQHYGEIPEGHAVIFADGNKRNFDINNLILVSKNELLNLNRDGLYYKDNAEATKCGVLIAKINIKQREKKKNVDKE